MAARGDWRVLGCSATEDGKAVMMQRTHRKKKQQHTIVADGRTGNGSTVTNDREKRERNRNRMKNTEKTEKKHKRKRAEPERHTTTNADRGERKMKDRRELVLRGR